MIIIFRVHKYKCFFLLKLFGGNITRFVPLFFMIFVFFKLNEFLEYLRIRNGVVSLFI